MQESSADHQCWGCTVEAARAQELDMLLSRWRQDCDDSASPFVGVLLTGADVFYLAARALAAYEGIVERGYALLQLSQDTDTRVDLSALNLAGADLSGACLRGAILRGARFDMASLRDSMLDDADLAGARLRDADLSGASLRGATLAPLFRPRVPPRGSPGRAQALPHPPSPDVSSDAVEIHADRPSTVDLIPADLSRAVLASTQLQGSVLRWACLAGANLTAARLWGADMVFANLEATVMIAAQLDTADLAGANLTGADLRGASMPSANLACAAISHARLDGARLENAHLSGVRLVNASMRSVQLQGADLSHADLSGAQLTGATLDEATRLIGASLTSAHLDQIHLERVNLATVDWAQVLPIGEEDVARKSASPAAQFGAAGRAYAALASELWAQGLDAEAKSFAVRASVMKRHALRHLLAGYVRKGSGLRSFVAYLRWQISWLLDATCGYGLRPFRLAAAALVIIAAGTVAQIVALGAPLSGTADINALLLSLSAFFSIVAGLQAEPTSDPQRLLFLTEGRLSILLICLLLASAIRMLMRR